MVRACPVEAATRRACDQALQDLGVRCREDLARWLLDKRRQVLPPPDELLGNREDVRNLVDAGVPLAA
eukprot:6236006-Alexandrium_andersonii.AAC.1